jgi:hypothetical protein
MGCAVTGNLDLAPLRKRAAAVLHSNTERLRELDDPPAHEDYGSRGGALSRSRPAAIHMAEGGQSCMHGDYAAMIPWLERVLSILVKSPELPVAPLYERMAALTYHLWGEQETALRHVEQALESLALAQRTQQGGSFVYDHRIATSHYSRIPLFVL